MARRLSPFASLDKDTVIGWLAATGSHDPDVLERERSELLTPARISWWTGAVLMFDGEIVSHRSRLYTWVTSWASSGKNRRSLR